MAEGEGMECIKKSIKTPTKGHHRDDTKNVISSSEIELCALKRTPNGMTVI